MHTQEISAEGETATATQAGRDININKAQKPNIKIRRQIMPVHLYIHAACMIVVLLILHRQSQILTEIEHTREGLEVVSVTASRNTEAMIKAANHEQDLYWTNYFNGRCEK